MTRQPHARPAVDEQPPQAESFASILLASAAVAVIVLVLLVALPLLAVQP